MTDCSKWNIDQLVEAVVYADRPVGPDRDHFEWATAARAELFGRLSTPKSIKGWKKKP